MARGQTQRGQQAFNQATGYAAEANRRGSELYSGLLPEYQKLVSGGGYSPEEQAGIRQATFGPLQAAFEAARERGTNRVERTRNPAGFGELEDELARSEGRQKATLAGGVEEGFANEAQRRKELGLAGLGRLYGINEEEMARLLGITPGLLETPRGGGIGGSLIGAGGSIAAALIGRRSPSSR